MRDLLLLSGGMDSIAIAYWKRPAIALTIDYGQKPAEAEVDASSAFCKAVGIEHHVLAINCGSIGSGDLAGTPELSMAPESEWWPFRNQLLVTLASAYALQYGMDRLIIGCLRTDGVHADGRPEFIHAMSRLLELQEGSLLLDAPAIAMSAPELVRASRVPFELLAWAHSCHKENFACGHCRGCSKHYETLKELGYEAY